MAYEHELAREGVSTTDGRTIEPDALEWDDGPLPLMEMTDENEASTLVGYIANIRRVGDRVYGDTSVDVEAVGIDIDRFELDTETSTITKGRIMGGHSIPASEYPWQD